MALRGTCQRHAFYCTFAAVMAGTGIKARRIHPVGVFYFVTVVSRGAAYARLPAKISIDKRITRPANLEINPQIPDRSIVSQIYSSLMRPSNANNHKIFIIGLNQAHLRKDRKEKVVSRERVTPAFV